MGIVTKHFVTFYSPGTMVSETSTHEVFDWTVDVACQLAHKIDERHGATPYGFRFTTRSRAPEDLDSKETATSPFYWLGGTIETFEEIEKRALLSERILLQNMKGNGWDRIIVNTNSWRFTAPLNPKDIVLDWKPQPQPKKEQEPST